ncbi:hypothetical protein HDU99_003563, partial [Rhizoclosmatium hyalinum]
MPLGCRYDQLFELGQNAECHARNKSVKFLGDSQVRVQWDVIDRRVVGTKELLAHNVHEGSRVNHYVLEKARNVYWEDRKEMPSPEEGEVRTTFDFAGRDGHLHWFSKEYMDNPEYEREGNPQSEAETNGLDRHMKKFDAMVFNVGMWPMSGIRDGGHFTTSRFKALIQWSAENMMEMNYRRGTVKKDPLVMVWHGLASYPVPAHISEDDKKRKDWRSPYRLKIWSDIAEEVLSKYHGMRRLNAHDLTQPFIYDTPDGGHYFKTPAVEAETDELLHKLNLYPLPALPQPIVNLDTGSASQTSVASTHIDISCSSATRVRNHDLFMLFALWMEKHPEDPPSAFFHSDGLTPATGTPHSVTTVQQNNHGVSPSASPMFGASTSGVGRATGSGIVVPAMRMGAVLVDSFGRVAAIERTGHSHAAVRCLMSASADIKGCDLYLSRFPCSLCMKVAVQAGVRKIYYFPAEKWELAATDEMRGAHESIDLFHLREYERAEKNRKSVMRLVSNNSI